MPRRFRPRFAVALSALALVAATIVPAGSAVAEEPPASDPIVTSEPTPEATPTEEPTPDTTPSPESTPTPEPAPEPEPSPAPEPDAVPAQMVEYSGTVNQIADEGHGDGTPAMALLNVPGQGFLPVDTSGLGAATDLSGPLSLTVAVPEDLTLSEGESQFEQLATYGATVAPLVAVDAEPSKLTAPQDFASAINQTPSTAATHKVYAVLVSPNGMASGPNNPTPAEAASLVGYANTYWSNQSSGNIHFSLVNTVPWYSSAYSCTPAGMYSGSVALWNEAATKASNSFGYAPGKNVHLLLIFPKTADCAGPIGLATIGGSTNDGGVAWVLGGASLAIRKATTAHELGHNLSLGHADWLECAASNPLVGQAEVNSGPPSSIDNCDINRYGDVADVMGFGIDNADGGSLSSPNAIRAGIWSAGSWVNAPQGVSTTVINSVSSNSGVRAVVAQDSDGTNYFVEFRNFTGDDSEVAAYGCGATSCAGSVGEIGVRILRMEPSGLQGYPGFDSFLIGRNTDQVKFQGDTYTTSTGMTIEVTDSTLTTATIEVTRPATNVITGIVWIGPTVSADKPKQLFPSGMQVGDTVSAFVGETWVADSFTYQWKRNGANIDGETSRDYILRPADLGQMITVTVTGAILNMTSGSATSSGYGPITAGVIYGAGAVSITGTLKLGQNLTANTAGYTAHDVNGSVVITPTSYQWMRNGLAIPSATNQTYMMQPADYLQKITVRATVAAPGYTPITSPASAAVTPNILGTIQGSKALPTMFKTINVPTFTLTATLPPGSVTEPGVTLTYQWYRMDRVTSNLTAIAGATQVDYTPVAADYAYKIRVRVTISKQYYTSLTLYSLAKDYSLRITQLKVGGPAIVGGSVFLYSTETGTTPAFNAEDDLTGVVGPVGATVDLVKWYGSGVFISGPTSSPYVVQPADVGKTLTYRVTVSHPGYLPVVDALSTASATVVRSALGNGATSPEITGPDPSMVLGLTSSLSDVAPAATSLTIQWYRNGVAVPNSTSASYALSSADFDKVISVKVTYKRSGFDDLARWASFPGTANFSVGTLVPGSITGSTDLLTAHVGTYESRIDHSLLATDAPTNPSVTWLRDGSPIAGADAMTYDPGASDVGKTISVQFTMTGTGLLPNVQVASATHGTNLQLNHDGPLEVSVDGTSTASKTVLRVTDTGGLVGPPPGVTTTYQWYRDGVAVVGATKSTYQLTAADKGHQIRARVITTKLPTPGTTYTNVVKVSPSHDYSILPQAVGGPYLSAANWRVGDEAGVYGLNFVDSANVPISSPSIAYQWYIGGVAVLGATANKFKIPASALGKKVTVRLTVTKPGFIPLVQFPPQPYLVDKGVSDVPTLDVVPGSGTGTLKAVISTPTPSYPAPVYTYQWYRDNPLDGAPAAAITGATLSTYKLVAADYKREITVKVTMTRTNFTVPIIKLAVPPEVDYSIVSTGAPTIGGTKAAGQQLTAIPQPYFEPDGTTPIATPPTLTYTWYRNGYVVAGVTGATYTLQGTDVGSIFKVRVTATLPGRVPIVSPASAATPTIVKGRMSPGTFKPVVTMINTSLRTMKVSFTGTPLIPTGGLAATYKWYREGVATPISTVSSYNLVAADTGKAVTVVVTLNKTGFYPYTYSAVLANGISHSQPAVIVGDDEIDAILACQAPTYSLASGAPVSGINGTITYQWYRESTLISGETGVNYTVADADQNSSLYCEVTVTAPYHDTLVEKTAAHVIPS